MSNVQVVSGVGNYNGVWGFKMVEGLSHKSSINFKDTNWPGALVNFRKMLSF